jgi:hypothetical protein
LCCVRHNKGYTRKTHYATALYSIGAIVGRSFTTTADIKMASPQAVNPEYATPKYPDDYFASAKPEFENMPPNLSDWEVEHVQRFARDMEKPCMPEQVDYLKTNGVSGRVILHWLASDSLFGKQQNIGFRPGNADTLATALKEFNEGKRQLWRGTSEDERFYGA